MGNISLRERRDGYGPDHWRLRRIVAPEVDAGLVDCAYCGERILPGEPWHLGHSENRRYYTGPEHVRCNCATKAREQKHSREW
jgi:hypothetical protein